MPTETAALAASGVPWPDADRHCRVRDDATLLAKAAAYALVLVDDGLEDGVVAVAFAEGVLDPYRAVYERAAAVADLTTYAPKGYAQVAVDDRRAHAHGLPVGDGGEGAAGAGGDAGEVLAKAACAFPGDDTGGRVKVGAVEADDAIGACKAAFPATEAQGEEPVFVGGAGGPEGRAVLYLGADQLIASGKPYGKGACAS